MQPQDDRALWDLLGQSPSPQVSGKFTDDTLRRIRLDASQPDTATEGSWFAWLLNSWRVIGGVTTGVAVLTLLFAWQNTITPTSEATILTNAPVDDPAAFKDLDLVLNDNELWLGTVSY